MRKLVPLVAASMGLSLLVPVAAVAAPDGQAPDRRPDTLPTLTTQTTDVEDMPIGDGTEAREYFVRLAGVPAALEPELTEEAPSARGEGSQMRYRSESAQAQDKQSALAEEQAEVATDGAQGTVGRELDVLASYTVVNHGFATTMTPDEARELVSLDEVIWVQEFLDYEPMTDRGPGFVNAQGPVWERPEAGLASGTLGEGVVVGIIDTGINPSSPSFAATSADGYEHTNPRGPGDYVGSCDPTNVEGGDGEGEVLERFGFDVPDGSYYDEDLAELCNDKLIGMWGYNSVTGSPIDYDGHGSHTGGTTAGGFADGVAADTGVPELEDQTFDVAGVAPRANVISYGACCTGVALTSAIDQAVVDGVDVINFSIGSASPTADVLQDSLTFGFLVARSMGVHVATSAGNAGPNAATIGSPADAPWLTSVAASTHDRLALNTLGGIVDQASDATLPAIEGKGVSAGLDAATELVYAGDFDNPLCLPDVWETDDVFDGQIVVCDRGETARVDKAEQAAAAGAGGFVLANDEVNSGSVAGSLNGDSFPIPGVHITFEDGVVLKDWMAGADDPVATISGTTFDVDDRWGDIVSIFSSRGPNRSDADVLTPHVTGPGVDILAPYGSDDSDEYQFISGTSMSSPHVAGALALLVDGFDRALTPSEAQSALQLTARRDVVKTDGETPADAFDVGSGHIDVDAALATGLVMDVDVFDHIDAATDGTQRDLNLPSLVDGQCVGTCSWERTLTAAPDSGTTTWTVDASGDLGVSVEPTEFTIEAGESVTLDVTADVTGEESEVPLFGALELTATSDAPDAHLPVVVTPAAFGGPESIEIAADELSGSESVTFTTAGSDDVSASVAGLAPVESETVTVPQDPSRDDPYEDLEDVAVRTVEVPEDARRLSVLIGETTAPDIDLFVGQGEEPSFDTQVCLSAAPASAERCDVPEPEEGTWWILVQNWEAGSDGVDDAELLTSVVPDEAVGNLTAEVPSSPAPGAFEVDLSWDLPRTAQRWFGDLTLTDGEVGSVDIPIELTLDEDALVLLPDADAGGPYQAVAGEPFTLDGSGSSHDEGMDLTYAWDVSQLGITSPQAGETLTVVPSVVGEREVTLTVTAEDGFEATDTATVEVLAEAPPAQTPPEGDACEDITAGSFPDVVAGPPHGDNIGCGAGYGVIQGKEDGTFDPQGVVRRDQMASFVARLLTVAGVDMPDVDGSGWADVTGGPHEVAIGQLTELGITQGRRGGERFDPQDAVTREQMASFVVRSLELVLDQELTAPRSPFTDTGGTHAANIDVAYDLGIALGRTPTTFDPSSDIRRDQMASFITRTLDELDERGVELTPLD